MILLTANTSILLAVQPADFRCGIDGFAAICHRQLAQDPRSGTLFVFINRNKTMLRALNYDGMVFWLMTKRLSKGKISLPTAKEAVTPMQAT
ncbi:IS66 family insertion sequence element accessory protein TnpB [Psychromonas aquimarina]|uniref:IS66 family insertion sequence element accessory protein TnpB n=1 Tax=Psychromonas aquimarina TaxID=444919 RepID=UPI0004152A89|nr:IS66 family insertion sequence element accessory protein TnpB [Psychromonas aquimarina]